MDDRDILARAAVAPDSLLASARREMGGILNLWCWQKADTTEHLAKAAPVNSNTIAVTRNMGLESLSEIEMQHYAQASASRRTGGPDMMD